jgi:hypothetical protein
VARTSGGRLGAVGRGDAGGSGMVQGQLVLRRTGETLALSLLGVLQRFLVVRDVACRGGRMVRDGARN